MMMLVLDIHLVAWSVSVVGSKSNHPGDDYRRQRHEEDDSCRAAKMRCDMMDNGTD
jgi:hypothetical protein